MMSTWCLLLCRFFRSVVVVVFVVIVYCVSAKFCCCCVVFVGGTKTPARQFHVMFFGNEGERGWVAESSTTSFKGRAAFDKFCQQMIRDHKKDKKLYQVCYNIIRSLNYAYILR